MNIAPASGTSGLGLDGSEPQPARKVYVHTFGCQMNVYDTDRIVQVLSPFNYSKTEDAAEADLILLNTCSVREKGEDKMLSELGRLAVLKEYNDELVLGVAGCVAQQEGARLLKKVPYLDLVFGPDNIVQLPELLHDVRGSKRRVAQTEFFNRKDYEFMEPDPSNEPARVSEFVTIMKGCDKVCSFCIVPFTRGREVSKPVDMVVREVAGLVSRGCGEVTLLGQNVNSYGKDRVERTARFAELIREVDKVEGLHRLRFTTSHPMDCIDDLIACFGDVPSLCEFFHLPVQSGSPRVLDAMRRKYTIEEYLGRVRQLRAQTDNMALSTDIIVGFPGETDDDFQQTLTLLETAQFDSIFAFKYSERPGTRAAQLIDDVDTATKKKRLAEVFRVQHPITAQRMQRYVGQTLEILVEGPSRNTDKALTDEWQMMGRSRTNVIVNVPVPMGDFWANRWTGQLAQVEITEAKAHSLYGRLA